MSGVVIMLVVIKIPLIKCNIFPPLWLFLIFSILLVITYNTQEKGKRFHVIEQLNACPRGILHNFCAVFIKTFEISAEITGT
jgi:hypothetical protein